MLRILSAANCYKYCQLEVSPTSMARKCPPHIWRGSVPHIYGAEVSPTYMVRKCPPHQLRGSVPHIYGAYRFLQLGTGCIAEGWREKWGRFILFLDD